MPYSLEQLAALVDGTLVDGTLVDEPRSDSASEPVMISGANPPRDAIEGEVTMIDDAVKAAALDDSLASAVVTPAALDSIAIPQIVVECPHTAFARLIETYRPPRRRELPRVGIDPTATVAISAGVHPTATVGGDVVIGENSLVMPGAVVLPGVRIGDDCVIHANVTLYEDTRIGDRVTIHAGSVIGAYGFGYRQVGGQHVRTAQLGFVAVEDDVEIGASVTIDRGTYGATRIGRGTKIDNQVMIAHNCRIGRHNLICSQVGIAGSCTTGDHVILAGQVGLKDHITLGDHTIVGAQAGVMDDCEGHQVYLGSPATPQRDQMQIMAVERKLPEMRRELKALRRDVDRFTRQDSSRDAA